MASIIYVVVGSTGEYESRRRWNVIAYADEALAAVHAANAQRVADEILEASRDADFPHEYRETSTNAYDTTGMPMDYNGARYSVDECVFSGEVA